MFVPDWAALYIPMAAKLRCSMMALVPSRVSLLLHSPMVRPAMCLQAEGCQSGACGSQRKRQRPAPPSKADMWKRPLFALCMGLVGYWQFTRLRCARYVSTALPTHTLGGQPQTFLRVLPRHQLVLQMQRQAAKACCQNF